MTLNRTTRLPVHFTAVCWIDDTTCVDTEDADHRGYHNATTLLNDDLDTQDVRIVKTATLPNLEGRRTYSLDGTMITRSEGECVLLPDEQNVAEIVVVNNLHVTAPKRMIVKSRGVVFSRVERHSFGDVLLFVRHRDWDTVEQCWVEFNGMYACNARTMNDFNNDILNVDFVLDFVGKVKGFNVPMNAWYMDVADALLVHRG